VAVVTGAGPYGVGRATARRLCDEGARVLIADVDAARADEAAKEIAATGGEVLAMGVDITVEDDVRAMVDLAVTAFGRLDVLHNNAFVEDSDPRIDLVRIDRATWDHVFAVNATGTMLACKHAVPHLQASGGGSIVNSTSVSALIGDTARAAYGAAKAAVHSLTLYAATMYGGLGIRCNSVAPALIMSGKISFDERQLAERAAERLLPWAADPEDIAAIVTWLASDDSRAITGQTIVADCGVTTHRPRHAMTAWEAVLSDDRA
jgi:NAD(P)-dependent dehydrogenase (short-subunit alcohol dehydrogenase family)